MHISELNPPMRRIPLPEAELIHSHATSLDSHQLGI